LFIFFISKVKQQTLATVRVIMLTSLYLVSKLKEVFCLLAVILN